MSTAVHPLQALLGQGLALNKALSSEALRERRDRWALDNVAGRAVEIRRATTAPALTAVSKLIHEAQRLHEPCVWICAEPSLFYPPDFEAAGIDLAALPICNISSMNVGSRRQRSKVLDGSEQARGNQARAGRRGGSVSAARAADLLMRSGGFGLVVLDLGAEAGLSMPIQTRLSALARHHETALVMLTRPRPGSPQLGSLVSLRCVGVIQRAGFDRFAGEIHIEKDKRRSPGWRHVEVCHGPDGMC